MLLSNMNIILKYITSNILSLTVFQAIIGHQKCKKFGVFSVKYEVVCVMNMHIPCIRICEKKNHLISIDFHKQEKKSNKITVYFFKYSLLISM